MPRGQRREGVLPDAGAPRLSPERAFVVQLESRRSSARRTFRGRVEHLFSGEAHRFGSLAELVRFLSRFS